MQLRLMPPTTEVASEVFCRGRVPNPALESGIATASSTPPSLVRRSAIDGLPLFASLWLEH